MPSSAGSPLYWDHPLSATLRRQVLVRHASAAPRDAAATAAEFGIDVATLPQVRSSACVVRVLPLLVARLSLCSWQQQQPPTAAPRPSPHA